jgi:hypothetical protein
MTVAAIPRQAAVLAIPFIPDISSSLSKEMMSGLRNRRSFVARAEDEITLS